jgi:hypothetical protein
MQCSSVLALAAALLPNLALAYTVKHTSAGAVVRWHDPHVALSVGPALRGRFGEDAVTASEIAIDAWQGLGGPVVELTERSGNTIDLASPWPYDPDLLAITETSYDDRTGRITSASIYVNPSRTFALLEEGQRGAREHDLGAVLTHEMGHLLGLGESDADRHATMWPRIGRGETHQRTLEADDEEGVDEVYSDAIATPMARGCQRMSVAPDAPLAPPWLLGLALLFLRQRLGSRRSAPSASPRGDTPS